MNSITHPTNDLQGSVRAECQHIVSHFYTSLPERLDRNLLPTLYEQDGLLLDNAAVHARYYPLPFFFLPAFPPIRPDVVHDVAVACQLLAEHLLLEDKLLDEQVGPGRVGCAVASLASKYKLEQALAYFHRHFLRDSSFLVIYRMLYEEYMHAVIDEKNRHEGRICAYSPEEMERIAKGKAAMGKIAPWSLGVATGEWAVADALADSWDSHSVSRQLYDDLRDWKTDFSDSRTYSFLLTRAMLEAGLAVEGQRPVQASQQQVGRAVFVTGWADRTLALAQRHGRTAIEGIRRLRCPAWEEWLESHQIVVERLRRDLSMLRQRAVHRARIGVASTPHGEAKSHPTKTVLEISRVACRNALKFLLREQRLGYPEAAHLWLEWTDPALRGNSCCIWGETFPRALCTDALVLARSSGLPVPNNVIDRDVRFLLKARADNTRGGWRYFGSHAAMCPDADDLGEIVQVIVRAGLPGTRDICEEPLRLLLDHNSHPDGSFDTWIADPEKPESVRAKAHLHEIWGAQADAEVMANVLYAMHLYDSKRFADAVRRGAVFLEGAQSRAGFWYSTWYAGNYYGTWVCVRVLSEVLPESRALSKARDYLIETQRLDGGWGMGKSNPLQTAFAVLGLGCAGKHARDCEAMSAGLKYLLDTQNSSGTWEATDFITLGRARARGALLEPSTSGSKDLCSYVSVTTTTAMCLEALLQAERFLESRLEYESADTSNGR